MELLSFFNSRSQNASFFFYLFFLPFGQKCKEHARHLCFTIKFPFNSLLIFFLVCHLFRQADTIQLFHGSPFYHIPFLINISLKPHYSFTFFSFWESFLFFSKEQTSAIQSFINYVSLCQNEQNHDGVIRTYRIIMHNWHRRCKCSCACAVWSYARMCILIFHFFIYFFQEENSLSKPASPKCIRRTSPSVYYSHTHTQIDIQCTRYRRTITMLLFYYRVLILSLVCPRQLNISISSSHYYNNSKCLYFIVFFSSIHLFFLIFIIGNRSPHREKP